MADGIVRPVFTSLLTHPTFANYELEVIKRFFDRFNINWVNYWRRR